MEGNDAFIKRRMFVGGRVEVAGYLLRNAVFKLVLSAAIMHLKLLSIRREIRKTCRTKCLLIYKDQLNMYINMDIMFQQKSRITT